MCGSLAAERIEAGGMTVPGRDGWMFLAQELRHVAAGKFWGEEAKAVTQATRGDYADPLPAILAFHRDLKALGVELIFLPVPPKAFVYPDKVGPVGEAEEQDAFPPRLDPVHRRFYELLRKEGVQVLDLTGDFIALRGTGEPPPYCRQDTHWSGQGVVMAARRIKELLGEPDWLRDAGKLDGIVTEWRDGTIRGDLWNDLDDPSIEQERVRLRFVGRRSGQDLTPVGSDRESPVILLGDSHTLVFHVGQELHAQGAGLADQLVAELGVPVDVIGVRGSGATQSRISLYRRSRGQASYFADKKAVVWCLAAREFTESTGWREVPVVRDR
jgi:alginate O-acetyltransferase complex protein AlgJ